jgi:hypothetical protein
MTEAAHGLTDLGIVDTSVVKKPRSAGQWATSDHIKKVSIPSAVFVLTIESPNTSSSSRPGNRQEEGALFKCVDVVRDAMVERKQPA